MLVRPACLFACEERGKKRKKIEKEEGLFAFSEQGIFDVASLF